MKQRGERSRREKSVGAGRRTGRVSEVSKQNAFARLVSPNTKTHTPQKKCVDCHREFA